MQRMSLQQIRQQAAKPMRAVASPSPFQTCTSSRARTRCRATPAAKQTLPAGLQGYWIKDTSRSQSMDRAMKLAQLNPLMQQAVSLIKAIQIKEEGGVFVLEVISVMSWLKISEKYPLDGRQGTCLRRDLRLGAMRGSVSQQDQHLRLDMAWDDPVRGSGIDLFRCEGPNQLVVESSITIGGVREDFRSVYTRQR